MTKRPLSITVISWIFVAAGVIGVAYHGTEFSAQRPFQIDLVGVCVVRLLAIVCGVFMLRGRNWARWLLVVWMGYHIILSALHTVSELVMHILLFAMIGFFLFRPTANAFFRRRRKEPQLRPD